MSNPNRCETCDYKQMHDGHEEGHCYMFRFEPVSVCMQHTSRKNNDKNLIQTIRILTED